MKILARVLDYLNLPVGVPLTSLPSTLQSNGGSPDYGSTVAMFNALNGANIAAGGLNFQTSAGAAITLTALESLYQKLTNGGAVVVTLDSAFNIVNSIPNAFAGQTFQMQIFSSGAGTVATPTLLDTSVTLVGTTSITAGNRRTYQGQITQIATTAGVPLTAGTTFTSITQIGTSNLFTLALATNALSPTVGNAILINVTAGTLPSGWYPVTKVNSATSLVIATPPGTVWTATAATLPGTTVIPTSAYTPGYTTGAQVGLYSPLVTITAVDSVAAIV